MRNRIAAFYYAYMYGEYESLTRWLWIYGHVSILLATALSGYAVARERYLLALALVPFLLVYLYMYFKATASGLDPEGEAETFQSFKPLRDPTENEETDGYHASLPCVPSR